MLKKRLIPCLLLKNGLIVRSEIFSFHQSLGNPIEQLERYNSWGADELIYLDISKDKEYDLKRDDLNVENRKTLVDIIEYISSKCFMPLTFGGGIKSIEDIRVRLRAGADKVCINSHAVENPNFVKEAAETFGSQCIVISIDVKINENSSYDVYINGGKKSTGLNPVKWARDVEKLGAGEIFLNSIDRDGMYTGYDIDLIKSVSENINIPLIACGGAGKFDDFVKGIKEGKASAVSAANIFHMTELSIGKAKKTLKKSGVNVRT